MLRASMVGDRSDRLRREGGFGVLFAAQMSIACIGVDWHATDDH